MNDAIRVSSHDASSIQGSYDAVGAELHLQRLGATSHTLCRKEWGVWRMLLLVSLLCCTVGHSRAQSLPSRLLAAYDLSEADVVADAMEQLRAMTVAEQIGQLIIPVWEPTRDSLTVARYLRLLEEIHPGGVLFRKGTIYDQYWLTAQLQRHTTIPLLITADAEWGLAMRLTDAIRYPQMQQLATFCTVEEIYQLGQHMAQQCRTIGIDVSFAPVLDVNNNPRNPVIGRRSFGATPEVVIAYGVALAEGLEDGGVLSVAKHFPGHGNTDQDSHKTLPTIFGTLEELQETELAPFQAYIDAGLGGIMVAHLSVPALESEAHCPSSLSRAIVTDLLRGEMHFKGLTFTDGLEMRGVQRTGEVSVSVAAILAGNDLLLGPLDPLETYQELLAAYREGLITQEMIEDRCLHILCYKRLLHSDEREQEPTLYSPEELYDALHTPELETFAEELQRRVSHAHK